MDLDMDYSDAPVQQAGVLRYLRGEISFETWLENQQNDDGEVTGEESYGKFGGTLHEDASTVFSSWGSAFTGGGGDKQDNDGWVTQDESEEEEGDFISEDDGTITDQTGDEDAPYDASRHLILPRFSNLPPLNANEFQVQGIELKPIAEMLPSLIAGSRTRKRYTRKRRLRGQEEDEEKDDDDEPLDIVTDFQNFRLRKRGRKVGCRNRMPELLRLQMGQANLLVAKGDFKQAADICMDIVREAPSCGLPFKTLAFIYEEQGDKEMSLQYALISAFLGCKDGQEWRDLARRCLDAGNRNQALVCYENGCRFAGGDVSLHWERANMYFEDGDFKKVLDTYETILKLLIPSDAKSYIDVTKKIAKLYLKYNFNQRATESLDVAFFTCHGVEDIEGVTMLSDLLMASKRYRRTIKLIVNHCHVILPERLLKHPSRDVLSSQNIENLERIIGESMKSNTKDLTAISSEIARSNAGDDSTETYNSGNDSKQYATLQPIQSKELRSTQTDDIYNIPDALPLGMRFKLACSLIYTKQRFPVEKVVEPSMTNDVETFGDYTLLVGEAFYDTGRYEEAIKYLLPLVEIKKYNKSAIWLKIAEIYGHINEKVKCINAYYKTLELSPLQASVRLTLATHLRNEGRDEEAIAVLAEYEDKQKDNEGDDLTFLSDEYILKVEEYEEWYKKCIDMYSSGKLRDFIYHSYILMHNYLMSSYTYNKKQKVGKALVWELLLKTLKVCMKFKEHRKAIHLVEQALLFKAYSESRKYRVELDYLQTTIYFITGEYSKAFDSFRTLLTHEDEKQINSNAIWNLFAQIVNKMLDKRHHRFTLRLLFKRPKLIPLIIQNGSNSHLCGTYKYAIGEFSRAFREWPSYPLISLLLGVSYLHLSCQKFHKTRHTSILHGLIFIFQYANLREENQEACFNIGRAFHQIGLVHFAVHYYNRALAFPLHDEAVDGRNVKYHPFIDLHREAAFNLSLIYKASGNIVLARNTLRRYCTV